MWFSLRGCKLVGSMFPEHHWLHLAQVDAVRLEAAQQVQCRAVAGRQGGPVAREQRRQQLLSTAGRS